MPDVTVKLSDGVREITVANAPAGQRAGFNGWALNSDTEHSGEE